MIHIYWHTDPSEAVQRAAEAWRQIAGEGAVIWTPADLPAIVERAQASCEDVALIDHVRHVANVVRWHLLYEQGGVWADADVTPLRRPNGYLSRQNPWCVGLGSVPTPFICGGPAGHDLWARTLAAALDHPQGSSPAASGGRLLQSMAQPSELELVPAKLFAERDASGRLLPTPPGGRYCTHEWRTSAARRRQANPR
jgi:hypothetical protein